MPEEPTPAAPASFAGQNVIAKIEGQDVGPLYCVQVSKGIATLQGDKTRKVPVKDIRLA